MSREQGPRVSAIDIAQVKHIANLARLAVSDQECEAFSRQLTTIIDYFNLLREAEVEGVEPANDLETRGTPLRDDTVVPSPPREELLANVPHQQGGYVQVGRVYPTADGGSDKGTK